MAASFHGNMRTKNQAACSIIIRAYNEEQYIGRLLTGIMEQTVENIEIIVVDSGSTDATVSIASRFPTRIVHIRPEEFTFGRSLNLGCSKAQGEFLVFASAHVYPVYTDWLEKLLEPFSDPTIALTYGMQRGGEITRYSEHQQFARMFPEESQIPQTNPLCNNANAAVRKALWERHRYDESLPGLEDLAWSTWALKEGYSLAYVAEAPIIHIQDEGPHQVYNRYKREAIALSRIRPREPFPLTKFLRLYFANILSDFYQAILDGKILKVFWEVLWYRWMQFWGTYVGFNHHGPLTDEVIQAFYYPNRTRGKSDPIILERKPIDYSGE